MTPKQLRFADAILEGCNPSEAYRLAYDTRNCTAVTIKSRAWDEQQVPEVAAYIAEKRAAAARNLNMTVEQVLSEWVTIASADPQELVRTRVRACRHCHGIGHAYQWRNEQEWAEAVAKVLAWKPAKGQTAEDAPPIPSSEGGFGFSVQLAPVPDCSKCDGDGEVDHLIADTRSLSPSARKLFAGVKVTKDGLQVLMRDQDKALDNIAKALGMLVEKRELTGKNGGPVVMQVTREDENL